LYFIYYSILIVLLSFGFYELATQYITMPSKRTVRVVTSIRNRQNVSQKFYNMVTIPLTKIIAKFIHLDDYRRKQLNRKLQRAGITLSPEEYHAKAIVTTLLIWVLSLIFIPLGLPIITMAMLLLGVIMYFKSKQHVDEAIKEINGHILDELPRFVRTYNNAMHTDKDLLKFIEKYRQVAGKDFCYDLDILITELKTGNTEEALQRFDTRINIPQLSTFISGVIGATRGVDQRTFFYMVENDMKNLAKENLKREIAKRPSKIRKATMAVGVMMFIIYLYPIFMDLKNGLGIFN
jgi:flagellar protein FlaJ